MQTRIYLLLEHCLGYLENNGMNKLISTKNEGTAWQRKVPTKYNQNKPFLYSHQKALTIVSSFKYTWF